MAGLGAAAWLRSLPAGSRGGPGAAGARCCRPRPAASPCARASRRRRSGSLAGRRTPASFKRGDTLEIAFANELPVPPLLNWRGLDGVAAAEPLTGAAAARRRAHGDPELPLRHAGTFLCDLGLLGDGQARPSRGAPLIVAESEPVTVDRDEVVLIEDWRLRPDGTADRPRRRSQGYRADLDRQRPTFVRSFSTTPTNA